MRDSVQELDSRVFLEAEDPERDRFHFSRLSEWLARTDLYGPRPFVEHRPAWTTAQPDVANWLGELSSDEISRLEESSAFLDVGVDAQDPPVPGAPEEFVEWWRTSRVLSRTPEIRPDIEPDVATLTRVGRRKLLQARRIAGLAALGEAAEPNEAMHVVDWCGGRGALARVLARAGMRVTVVDRDAELLGRTSKEARAEGTTVRTEVGDALDPRMHAVLRGVDVATALHACGSLTTSLFEGAGDARVPRVVAAPCCPHRLRTGRVYRGRSRAASSSGVALDDAALRLATAGVRVAPGRVRAARERELVLRQALDLALRDATGVDRYTPIGALPRSVRRLGIREFIEREFAARELSLPPTFDAAHYESAGRARVHEARALGIVRALFRRPIEIWTDLDHGLAEREKGRSIRWGRFCDSAVTPRNIAIESRS